MFCLYVQEQRNSVDPEEESHRVAKNDGSLVVCHEGG